MTQTAGSKAENSDFHGKWAPNGRVARGATIVLFVLGLGCTLLGAVPLLRALPVLLYAKRAWASVVAVEALRQPENYRVWVEFETAAGEKTRAKYDLSDQRRGRQKVPRLVQGQQVEVFYSVQDPQRVELYSLQAFWVGSWWWLVLGVFMLWLSNQGRKARGLAPADFLSKAGKRKVKR